MNVVDAHHHLWDLKANYYPWLVDRVTKRVCGEYSAIRRDYLIADYLRDIAARPVAKSVHVQAEHDDRDPVRETRWLQSIADDVAASRGFPHGIVGYADLAAEDALAVLEGHCRYRNIRGIRQSLNGVLDRPESRDLLHHPAWRKQLPLLARFGLSYDLQIYPAQMADMTDAVRANEKLQFILCHAGLPSDRSSAGLELWRHGMHSLAELPNVAVKISGFGMFDRAWTTESIRPLVLETIDTFGVDRCMFASNFPVDGMAASYDRIWQAFDVITRAFATGERSALFHDNASRYYRL